MNRIENDASAGTYLTSSCLATIEGLHNRPTDSPLIPYEPYRKRRVQQFFYCCAYSLPRERVCRAGDSQRHTCRLMRRFMKVRRWDGLRLHKDLLSHLRADREDTQTQRTRWSYKPTSFVQHDEIWIWSRVSHEGKRDKISRRCENSKYCRQHNRAVVRSFPQ
jgi:hypothetical protein